MTFGLLWTWEYRSALIGLTPKGLDMSGKEGIKVCVGYIVLW